MQAQIWQISKTDAATTLQARPRKVPCGIKITPYNYKGKKTYTGCGEMLS